MVLLLLAYVRPALRTKATWSCRLDESCVVLGQTFFASNSAFATGNGQHAPDLTSSPLYHDLPAFCVL